ncbi:50S ribosomal protein L13 [Candidatus Cerribacteria bacterium 'Amazon FNV 2010 28 9']|uniref:Large ribosomal subunit protein uL13 n=1 Tax=Candidatus Cerribacteria bacterium 'Amazon FNV 2010 28 9' TaxID=2081795 RepID=A0A317JRV2_9BACT|nr:MAG: 50S ribosomal protein L13 [Candidatus Cerribacteria bacterium 'Amazon FNV 2010 28 9']
MKTYQAKPAEVRRTWHLIDAEGKVLGDLSVEIARKLMGKHKVTYTPHVDSGDFVVVINATKVVLTGKKATTKMYYSHSGIPGGFKALSFEQVMAKDPRRVIEHAVKGMIPKNKQQDRRMARLKVFVGNEHTYTDKFGK